MSAEGLFGPGSATWRVNGETAMILGGGRALILQMAHPHIGAAVDQHSRYRDDRWGRLRHTLATVGEILFGDTETATRSAERMRRLHARFLGMVPEGRAAGQAYDATDPALVRWVWATLVDTSLLVYGRYVRTLTPCEVERYYSEQRRFAEICGVPPDRCPASYASFRTYFDTTAATMLEATPAARDAATLVMNPLRLARVGAPVAALTGLPTAALLPARLRADLGVPWSTTRELLFKGVTGTVRTARPALPVRLRRVRSARLADERIRRAAAEEHVRAHS